MENSPSPREISELSFEEAIAELESLIAKMENGGMPLAALTSSFERGRLLSAHCKNQLNTLERKITVLASDDGKDGEWRDFESAPDRRFSDDEPPF